VGDIRRNTALNRLTQGTEVGIVSGMADLGFSKKIALRYLWSKRSEAFISIITVISIIGVAIGVMVLNIVMAVMTGFEHELREKIVGTDSHIVVSNRSGGRIEGWQGASDTITQVAGVDSSSPFTYNQVLIRSDSRSSGLLVRGISKGSASAQQVQSYLGADASLDTLFTPPTVTVLNPSGDEEEASIPGIVIGKSLARSLGVFVGTPVSILSPQVTSTPFGLVPSFRRFVVVGLYSSGLAEYESGVAYIALEEAQRFFGMGDGVSGLEVRVRDVSKAPEIAREVLSSLGGISSGFSVRDWTETNRPLWEAIQLEKRVYFIVLLLIIVMASFSIVTTLIMIVLEKRKDIAIMKTMGASTASVSWIFRMQGAVIGGLGTLIGLVLGFVGCVALKKFGFPIDERIFQMSTLPIHIDPLNFAMVGIAAFCICFFATIYPARRAAQLEPSEVLRYD
jgi:lipoprotein-releasing system permease protein